MAIYDLPPPHERLNVFFGELFARIRKNPPSNILQIVEEKFKETGYREINTGRGINNILIVRLDAIGDMIITSGFIREVRANFPYARITLVVSPIVVPMVELCPYVNEIFSLDKKILLDKPIDEVLERVAVFCRDNLWRKNFSIAFAPRWDGDTLPALIMVYLSGARERIGYGVNPFYSWLGEQPAEIATMNNFLLTKNIVTPRSVISEIEKNFYLLEAVGLKVNQTHMELWYDAEDFRRAKDWLEKLPSDSKKIILGIGASAATKKYPVEKYLVALKELAERNLSFIIVGGSSELDDADFLEKNLPPDKVLNLTNKTTLRETEAIAAQVDFYIGNDTGVLHMAAAAHVPIIGIYRGSVEMENVLPAIINEFRRFPPYGTKAIALRPAHPIDECATSPPVYGLCKRLHESHCIAQIPPQAIIEAFDKLEEI